MLFLLYTIKKGVKFKYNRKPIEILDDGVIFQGVIEHDDGTIKSVESSDKFYPSDSVIVAISQGPRNVIVSTTTNLEVNKSGLLVADG